MIYSVVTAVLDTRHTEPSYLPRYVLYSVCTVSMYVQVCTKHYVCTTYVCMYVRIQVIYQYTHMCTVLRTYFGRNPWARLLFVSQQPISVMINPCLRLPLIGVRQAWMKKGFASHSGQQRSIDAGKSDFLIAGLKVLVWSKLRILRTLICSICSWSVWMRHPHLFSYPWTVLCLSLAHFPDAARK